MFDIIRGAMFTRFNQARRPFRAFAFAGAFSGSLLVATPALALQPLAEFTASAASKNPDAKETAASARGQEATADEAFAQLLPSFTARGVFTHNQLEGVFDVPQADGSTNKLVFQPRNQLDAFLTLSVPIVDLPGHARLRASRRASEAASLEHEATSRSISAQVAAAYYRMVGFSSLVRAANAGLAAATDNQKLVLQRQEAGAATELDTARATAAVARARADAEETELNLNLAARQLRALSGLVPDLASPSEVAPASLAPEGPLEQWLAKVPQTPAVRAAEAAEDASRLQRRAGTYAYFPTLSASADQRFTNATGFVGRNAVFALSATLTWQLDFGLPARARSQQAAADAASARAEKAASTLRENVAEQWHRVQANVSKVRASRAAQDAARLGNRLAKQRYAAGAATQVELVTAQKEAFDADAAVIQAEADLALARALLQIATETNKAQP
jgi:outer membrane protein TolC